MSNIFNFNKEIMPNILLNDFYQTFFIISLFILIFIVIYKILLNVNKDKDSFVQNNSEKKILDLIENTPVIYIKSLSQLTGHNIYAKCEYFNYYTSKDRVIKRILLNAKEKGLINKDSMIYESSTGLSGYSTASISQLLGYSSTIVIPESCSKALISQIKKTNCKLILTKNVDFSNFSHNYIRLCKKLSNEDKNGFYINLYQNELNFITNFEEIGPELYRQLNNKVDAFVCGSDTGGTISGISNFLKIKNKNCFVALADTENSGFSTFIKEGVLFRKENKSGKNKNDITDIIIGNCFLNNNLRKANIDNTYIGNFYEAMFMVDYVKKYDGIDIGFNEGLNLVGILKMIKDKNNNLPNNSNIATIFLSNGIYDSEKIISFNWENNPIKNIEEIF